MIFFAKWQFLVFNNVGTLLNQLNRLNTYECANTNINKIVSFNSIKIQWKLLSEINQTI